MVSRTCHPGCSNGGSDSKGTRAKDLCQIVDVSRQRLQWKPCPGACEQAHHSSLLINTVVLSLVLKASYDSIHWQSNSTNLYCTSLLLNVQNNTEISAIRRLSTVCFEISTANLGFMRRFYTTQSTHSRKYLNIEKKIIASPLAFTLYVSWQSYGRLTSLKLFILVSFTPI